MGKAPCCSKVGLHKGPWSTKEDTLLTNYIQAYGEGQWRSLPKKAGLLRCGKSCRLRWMNYLRPGIKRGNITSDEEDLIIRLHSLLGNRWSLIAGRLPGRTDNEIKNYWNTHLIKKLRNAGIEPKSNKNHVSKKPKESKKKKTMAAAGAAESNDSASRKKKLQKNSSINDSNSESSAAAKIKVYVPKPIRISPGFSSNNSIVDSPLTCSSSSHEEEEAKNEAMMGMSHFDDHEEAKAEVSDFGWPFFELGDSNYGGIHVGEVDDQVLIEDCNFSFQDSLPTISNMLEKVYDEYLQLL